MLDVPGPFPIYGSPVPRQTHLSEHWRIVLRHRWLVLLFLALTVVATAAWTFTTRPLFRATALLRIEKDEPRVVKFDEVLKANTGDDYYQTQYQILQSRSLATSVIAGLRLDQHPDFQDFDRTWFDRVRNWVNRQFERLTPDSPVVETAAKRELGVASPVTDAFLKRVVVEPVRTSRLVKVGFESHYPDVAARVTNTLADTFIAQQLQHKTATTGYATSFLTTQLDEAGQKLRNAETRLTGFLKANNIFFLNHEERTGEQQELTTQQMSQLSDALQKARAERIAKQSRYSQTVGQEPDRLPAVLASPLVMHLKEEVAKSEAEYGRLGQTFKPEYPRMEQLKRSIAELRRQLGDEVRRILNGLEHEYQAALLTERQLQQAVDSHQALARKLGDQMPQYSVLRRDVDTNRQVYMALLTRLKETQVSSALITSNISLVDRAEIPRSPYRPRTMLNLLLAVVVGLFGGVGLAFLVEYLDTTIRDAKELENVLSVPIGLVPRAAMSDKRLLLGGGTADKLNGRNSPAVNIYGERDPVFADAFRTLRTTLLYCSAEHAPGTLMVTSPQRGEGKTTIATNLAIALAQHGTGDVLLIDADLRRPDIHDIFDVSLTPGFADFLNGRNELADVIRPTDTAHLFIVPAGWPSRTRLADLLATPRLDPSVGALAGRFKHIVFDTTPLFGTSDALSLAPHVGGVLLVLRHGQAHREAVRRAAQLLGTVRTPFVSVVLNRFDPSTAAAYYDYAAYPSSDVIWRANGDARQR
jgi:capsular exopolysaccharide synthesis family protein